MSFDLANEQLVELHEEFDNQVAVLFDSDQVTLEGRYEDELSIFRAKKVWTEVLETNFLLEKGDDFKFGTLSDLGESKFVLKCSFSTACGRYAFWRLVNSQAPESQYLIETAHIPDGASHHFELLRAPDLKSTVNSEHAGKQDLKAWRFVRWMKHLLDR